MNLPSKSINKAIAREWLVFIACTVFSAVAVSAPGLCVYALGRDYFLGGFFSLFDFHRGSDSGQAWLLFLAPYMVVQFVRSIVWSVKAIWNR